MAAARDWGGELAVRVAEHRGPPLNIPVPDTDRRGSHRSTRQSVSLMVVRAGRAKSSFGLRTEEVEKLGVNQPPSMQDQTLRRLTTTYPSSALPMTPTVVLSPAMRTSSMDYLDSPT